MYFHTSTANQITEGPILVEKDDGKGKGTEEKGNTQRKIHGVYM
jgi:hypothetical protein